MHARQIRWTELFTKNVYPQRGNALFLNIITIADAHETVKLHELFYDLKVQITYDANLNIMHAYNYVTYTTLRSHIHSKNRLMSLLLISSNMHQSVFAV